MHDDRPADRAARHIFDERRRGDRFRRLPDDLRPGDLDRAYDAQDALRAVHRADGGHEVAGYKVALTSKVMQDLIGVDHPIAGCIFANRMHGPEADLRAADFVNLGVESEIAVRLGADLPPAGQDYDRARIAAAIASCMPATEIIDDRKADYADLDILTAIVDNGWNAGCVLGPETGYDPGLDLAALRGTMHINDRPAGDGWGRDVLGHPLESVTWLANHLAARGQMLRKDDIVLTGSVVATKWLKAGDRMRTSFDRLGGCTIAVA